MIVELRAIVSGHERANRRGVLRDGHVEDVETRAALAEPHVDQEERPVGVRAKHAGGARCGRCAAPHQLTREHVRERACHCRIVLADENRRALHFPCTPTRTMQ